MCRLILVFACLLAMALPVTPSIAGTANGEALATIKRLQELLRADTNTARYRMMVVTPEWRRSLTLESWDDRPGKRFFIHILEPEKDKDTTFLKVGANLWMYLPKLERDIRIPPSMMLSSWMGSDFTNDDLVKSSSVVEDYTHRILHRDANGVVIESLPRAEAAVVWGKLVHRVSSDGMPEWEEFYDEHGKLVRRLLFEQPHWMDGRRIPTRWVMLPLTKPGHQTIMEIERIRFDVPIDPGVFERANLARHSRSR